MRVGTVVFIIMIVVIVGIMLNAIRVAKRAKNDERAVADPVEEENKEVL